MISNYSADYHHKAVIPEHQPLPTLPEEEVLYLEEGVGRRAEVAAVIKKIIKVIDPSYDARKEIKKIYQGKGTRVGKVRLMNALPDLIAKISQALKLLRVNALWIGKCAVFIGFVTTPIDFGLGIRHAVRVKDFSEGVNWKEIKQELQPGRSKESLLRKVFTENINPLRDRMELSSDKEIEQMRMTLRGRVRVEKKVSRINLALVTISTIGGILSAIPGLGAVALPISLLSLGAGLGLSLYHSYKCYKFDKKMGLIVRKPDDPFFMVASGKNVKTIHKVKDFAKWYFEKLQYIDIKKGILPIEAKVVEPMPQSRQDALAHERPLL